MGAACAFRQSREADGALSSNRAEATFNQLDDLGLGDGGDRLAVNELDAGVDPSLLARRHDDPLEHLRVVVEERILLGKRQPEQPVDRAEALAKTLHRIDEVEIAPAIQGQ